MITSFRRAGFMLSGVRMTAYVGGGGALLLLLLIAALGWLGTHAPGWTLWLAAAAPAGKGQAKAGVGIHLNNLAARLEGLGARDAAQQLRDAEQLYHCMGRQGRVAMGLPPAAGPNAVSHYLKDEAIQRLSGPQWLKQRGSPNITAHGQAAGPGCREYALFDAMAQQNATFAHTHSPSGSMKLQPGVISEL